MKLRFCATCGTTVSLEHHHLVTRPEGGTDEKTNLITLCTPCHFKLHKRQLNGTYNASENIKAALVMRKAQGVRLGGLNAGGIRTREEAKARAEALRPILNKFTDKSTRAIAAELNDRGVPTPTGGPWYAQTVIRVQRRLGMS
jgi:hypothetical protein